MRLKLLAYLVLFSLALPPAASADALTKIVQQDLVTLGYEPGNTDGEETTQTVIAISKFQAEHDLEVTGEITPQLAGVIKAAIKNQGSAQAGAAATPAEPAVAQRSEEELRDSQQACLQEKYAAAHESQKKKRGFGRLLSAVSRASSTFGNSEIARDVSRVSYDVYQANATAADLEAAAKDLGLTEDDIEACRNP
jgi:peptidoglycan hydrolase-like protein with peptidoglycan-binding domain